MQMNTKGYETKIYQDPDDQRKDEGKERRDNIFFYVLIVVVLLLLLGCCCLASTNNVLPNFFGGALSNIGTNLSSITGIGSVNIDGTDDQVIVQSDASGNFVLLTPQPISTTSSPTFSGMTLTNYSGVIRAENGSLVAGPLDLEETNNFTNALNVLNGGTGQTTAPALNQILVGDGNGGYRQLTITPGGGIDISSNGSTLTISNTSMGGGGTVMSVTAGNGLVNSGTLTDPVIEMISLNAGLVINNDDIALNLATSGTSSTTNSNSGLEITAAGLRLLGGCSNNQILKWNSGTSVWECSNDNTGAPESGITSLNGLTDDTQTFASGTSGSDFNIVSAGTVHTFNIPSASTTARGLVTTGVQTFGGNKTFANNVSINGNTTLGTTDAQTVTFNALVSSSIRPATDNTYDLGSLATRWRDLYLGPSSLRITSTTGTSGTGSNYTLFAAGYNSGTATLQTTNFGTNTTGNFGGIDLVSGINSGQGANQAINLRASNNLGPTDSLLRVGDSGTNVLNILGNGQTTLTTDTLLAPGSVLSISSSISGWTGGTGNLIDSTFTIDNDGLSGNFPAIRGYQTSITNALGSITGLITGMGTTINNNGQTTSSINGSFVSVNNSGTVNPGTLRGVGAQVVNNSTGSAEYIYGSSFAVYNDGAVPVGSTRAGYYIMDNTGNINLDYSGLVVSQQNSGTVSDDIYVLFGSSTNALSGVAGNLRGSQISLTNSGTLSDNIVSYDTYSINNGTTPGYNGYYSVFLNAGSLSGTNDSSLFGGTFTNQATGTTDELNLLRLSLTNDSGGVIGGDINLAFLNTQIAGSVTGNVYGYRSEILNQSSGTIGGDIFGVYSSVDLETSSTFNGSNIYQFYGGYEPVGSRTGITGVNHYGLSLNNISAGQNNYGIRVNNVGGCGTCLNGYGMYVGSISGSTNNYGIYIQDATTYAIWADAGITRLDGETQIGTTGAPTSWLSLGAASTSRSSINIASSATTNVSSPVSGDLWWNGTELFFYNGSTNVNLLAGGGGSPGGSNSNIQFNAGGVFGGSDDFIFNSMEGIVGLRSLGTSAFMNIGAASSSYASLNIASSASTDPTSPTSGDLWWNGTELFFYNGSTNVNLLAGGGGGSPYGNDGAIQFNQGGVFGGADYFNYDYDNDRLGLGLTNPETIVDIWGDISGLNGVGIQLTNSTSSTSKIAFVNHLGEAWAVGTETSNFTVQYGTDPNNTGSELFWINQSGVVGISTTNDSAYVNITNSSEDYAHLNLVAGTDPGSPVSGDLWWNGTQLYFNDGTSNVNLLPSGSYVNLQPSSAQNQINQSDPLINLDYADSTFFGQALVNVYQSQDAGADFLKFETNLDGDVFSVNGNGQMTIENSIGLSATFAGGIRVDEFIPGNGTFNLNENGVSFGEQIGIYSNRAGGDNIYGLDFITNSARRFGITEFGDVYISNLPSGSGNDVCWDSMNAPYVLVDCTSSTRALKNNIETLSPGLDAVLALRPVQFNWNSSGAVDLGFIAEEVYEVNPLFAVVKDGEVTGVKYRQLSALLVKAVQDLNSRVDGLEDRIANLEDSQLTGNASVTTGTIEKFVEVKNMKQNARIMLSPRSGVPTGVTYYAESREDGFVIKLSTTVRKDISFDYLLIFD